MRILFLILILMSIGLVACSQENASEVAPVQIEITPTPISTPTPASIFEENFTLKDCNFSIQTRRKYQCGYLQVPLDYGEPDGLKIDISIAIFYAENPTSKENPLAYLHGGPGSHSLETIPFIFNSVFSSLASTRDLVFFDQRGVGTSKPSLNCPEVIDDTISSLNIKQSIEDQQASFMSALRKCHDRLVEAGINFSHFNTLSSARDANSIRNALGYEVWDLLGVSYGTRLAQTIMREFPESIGKVVLDSSYGLEQDIYASVPQHADRAFRLLIDRCISDTECHENYPNLETKLYRAVSQLDEYPMPGNAVMIKADATSNNGFAAENIPTLMTGNRFVSVLFQSMYQSELIPWLPEVISNVSTGNVEAANILLSNDLSTMQYTSLGQYYSVQCPDEISFTNLAFLRESSWESEFFRKLFDSQDLYAKEHISICEFWDASSSAWKENQPVVSSIPSLILTGEFDPITPPSDGETVAGNLSNSSFVIIPGASHGVLFSSACALFIATEFLKSPVRPDSLDTKCANGIGNIDWVTPLKKTGFQAYSDPISGIESIKPEGWDNQAPGFFSRTSLGLVGLAQQIVPGTTAEDLLPTLVESFGVAASNTDLGEIKTDLYSWGITEISSNGQITILATTTIGSSAAVVLASGLPSQRNDLIESILRPVTKYFRVQYK